MNVGKQPCSTQQRKAVPIRERGVRFPCFVFSHQSLANDLKYTVWRCPKADEQCQFFLWAEHEAGTKESINFAQRPSCPQTPTRNGAEPGQPDQPIVLGAAQHTLGRNHCRLRGLKRRQRGKLAAMSN